MPRRSKGPRLWLQPARAAREGRPAEAAVWVIRDGSRKLTTGVSAGKAGPPQAAKDALRNYLNTQGTPRIPGRDPASVAIASVVAIYTEDVAKNHARPNETAARLERIIDFFKDDTLDCLNKAKCNEYVEWRGATASARRELEDLRAAVRHHWEAGLCSALTPVVLPERGEGRERWLTRKEAARLLWAAWKATQTYKGDDWNRKTAQHVARFILVGLYTGTRAGAICGAAMAPTEGHGWIDLEHGVFYRRAIGKKKTKKRQPSIRIPPKLLAHMRRWKRKKVSHSFLIEWQGEPVLRVNKAFQSVVKKAKLGDDVTPHVLRHTAITWQAQLGVPDYEICGFFGITKQVFENVYAHHHPDYQSNAVNALNKRERVRKVEGNVVPLAKAQ